jgi:hypothetical protein
MALFMNTGESFYRRAVWRKRFIWKKPRRCELTGGWIWLMFAYEGICMWTGAHEPVIEFRYHKAKEHILWLLQN